MVDSKENNKSDRGVKVLTPKNSLASNFSLHYHTPNHTFFHDIKGNDHQLKKLLIIRQILLVSTLGNVWRMCVLI